MGSVQGEGDQQGGAVGPDNRGLPTGVPNNFWFATGIECWRDDLSLVEDLGLRHLRLAAAAAVANAVRLMHGQLSPDLPLSILAFVLLWLGEVSPLMVVLVSAATMILAQLLR